MSRNILGLARHSDLFERPLEEQYLQTLLTNTFGNTFYVSHGLQAEAALLHDRMVARDPAFAARALVYARQRGLVRAQPLFGLAKLASVPEPHLESAFGEVVLTPTDLGDFTTVVKLLRASEGGRRLKRLAGGWLLERLSEHWVIKYGAARPGNYSLRDLFRVYHPRARDGEAMPLVNYLLGKSADVSGLPQIAALERLKKATSDEARVAAIDQGRLPYEVVTPFARSRAVWAALTPQLPLAALLRHLAALDRQGVTHMVRAVIEGKLQNAKVIRSSKILPHRFVEVARQVRTPWLREALYDAGELSFANVPVLAGRTAVLLERSRSAQTVTAAALLLRNSERLLWFDDPVAALRQLAAERDAVDNLVLISRQQHDLGGPFLAALDEYRRKVKPEVRAFLVDVAPCRVTFTAQDPASWYLYGWSEQALAFLSMTSRGFGSMVEAIKSGLH
jgi:60 kDa SS-A/Ro ribonucleoprotein